MPAYQSLLGYLCTIDSARSADDARATFANLARRQPDLELSTPSRSAQLLLSPHDKVGSDPTGSVTVVLCGEVYENADNQASFLAQGFAERGFDWVKELHGSFALVVADKHRDRMAVMTDRLNSRRMFAGDFDGGICISAQLASQSWDSFDLDPTGVAWYLTNRIVGNSRTLLEGVSVLTRSCVHELTGGGLKSAPYWRYDFSQAAMRVDQKQLVEGLRARLIRAVERRLYDSPTVFLSLSAGYDATGLLGILAYELRAADVQCFSYDHEPIVTGSDADLAQKMAERAGYQFELVESYDGDFIGHLRNNSVTGLRSKQSWYCAEEGAWKRLAPRLSASQNPIVMVGDECLGWRKYALRDIVDVLASLQFYNLSVMSWLLPLLPADSRMKFEHGLNDDFDRLHAIAVEHKAGDWHNSKDWLYLDQRLGNIILPWRESFVPDGVAVRSPLLDNDILDFMMTVPIPWRLNKRLYRKTITAMYPQLFDFPRSSTSGNYFLNLTREFRANADEVRRLIEAQSSRLDNLVPPDVLTRLLVDVLASKRPSAGGQHQTRGIAGAMHSVASRALRRVIPAKPPVQQVEPANMLMRLLVLRMALAKDGDGQSR